MSKEGCKRFGGAVEQRTASTNFEEPEGRRRNWLGVYE